MQEFPGCNPDPLPLREGLGEGLGKCRTLNYRFTIGSLYAPPPQTNASQQLVEQVQVMAAEVNIG